MEEIETKNEEAMENLRRIGKEKKAKSSFLREKDARLTNMELSLPDKDSDSAQIHLPKCNDMTPTQPNKHHLITSTPSYEYRNKHCSESERI